MIGPNPIQEGEDLIASACESTPCLNDGECGDPKDISTIEEGTYLCSCTDGWYGTNCETSEDDCDDTKCTGKETCVDCARGTWNKFNHIDNPDCQDGFTCEKKPKGSGGKGRRLQDAPGIHYQGSGGCNFASFDSRITEVNTACCGVDDVDDECDSGIPESCDVECAGIFKVFYKECKHMLDLAFEGDTSGFATLDTTCSSLPAPALINVIAKGLCACTTEVGRHGTWTDGWCT